MRRRDRISRSGSARSEIWPSHPEHVPSPADSIRERPSRQMTNEEIRGYERSADPFLRSLATRALDGSEHARDRLAREIDIIDDIANIYDSRTRGPW